MKNQIIKLIEDRMKKLPEDDVLRWNCLNGLLKDAEALILPVVGIEFKDKQINRFEVIDKIGRAYVNICDRPLKIEASLQDDERTLKIFLDD